MEHVLKAIANQANLDRVLFTPSMKKVYFEMALGAGGMTQFKHTENVRSGLSFIADKADDKKHAVLFCQSNELVYGYDILVEMAAKMLPAVVLGIQEGAVEEAPFWTSQELDGTGWIQFHTHTLQEAYDHLSIAFLLFEKHKVKLPVMILHSALKHESAGEFTAREDLDLGNPLMGLATTRVRKTVDFESALAAAKEEKEKPTIQTYYNGLLDTIRELYATLGYVNPPEGLPYRGDLSQGESAVLSLIPPESEDPSLIPSASLFCHRPFSIDALRPALTEKKAVAVVEAKPAPGVVIPPLFAEAQASLASALRGTILSITVPPGTGVLDHERMSQIAQIVNAAASDPDASGIMRNID